MIRRTYLDGILAEHRDRAAADNRDIATLLESCRRMEAPRGFRQRLVDDSMSGLAVISEIKRRSPSKGDLNASLDPSQLARNYASGGASCLSVLTDEAHFGGSSNDLKEARSAVDLPVLRKDFTVDARDVVDARLMGADCVLLIAAALVPEDLAEFHRVGVSIGLDVLVEIHDEAELEMALAVGASLIGVNQRDLVTFDVDHDRAVRMAEVIPDDVVKVAESGVRGVDDARALRDAGYDAVLVGESLVTAQEPLEAVRALRAVR